MDTDLLYQQARSRFEHAAARKALKEKYEAKMIFSHAGGMWRAGPELLSLLMACPDGDIVLLDLYDSPVKVASKELIGLATQRWQEQMNAWLVEYKETNSQR